MTLRLIIWVLRKLLWSMLSIVIFTVFGGGRTARRVLRWMSVLRRMGRFVRF